MSASLDSAESAASRVAAWSAIEPTSMEIQYRVAAFPADYAITDDVMLRDETGRPFLLSRVDVEPVPIEESLANSLGMFFEPSQDSSWHTISELRRIIYGIDEPEFTIH